MSNKCHSLRHVGHIMPGATAPRLLIEMDNMVNMKMKSNMNDQNKNIES